MGRRSILAATLTFASVILQFQFLLISDTLPSSWRQTLPTVHSSTPSTGHMGSSVVNITCCCRNQIGMLRLDRGS